MWRVSIVGLTCVCCLYLVNLWLPRQTHNLRSYDDSSMLINSTFKISRKNSSTPCAMINKGDEQTRNESWCIDAFMNRGFVPPQMYQSKTPNELKEWFSNDCHQIFCEDEVLSKCTWTYRAIEVLFADERTMKCNEEVLNQFELPEIWKLYKFSDFFHNRKNIFNGETWRTKLIWEDSLFGYYHSEALKHGVGWGQYQLLDELVKEKTKLVEGPPQNSTVIHLRLGDVLSRKEQSVFDLLHHQNYYYPKMDYSTYVKPLQFYSSTEMEKNIVLVGGLHESMNKDGSISSASLKSCQYVSILKRYFEARGIVVQLRLGQPPDDDFLYVAQSERFIPGGGGFSQDMAGLVQRFGGKVINYKPNSVYMWR
mmetsp:Transcript_7337/g.8421  ORF Transcript_7337/g.8421 Transcript_7337/m.8421 type:complete len:367 (+) Transcript_7337:261-1361(+)